jgi:hypothetical protein
LQPHTLALCLGILALLTLVNMRGVHDTGVVFMIPTYLFLGTLMTIIGVGLWQVAATGGHPHPVMALPVPSAATEMISIWLILKVFSSGCAAMTGVEAVSNGVMAFREDARKNAKITLTIIIALLCVLLLGIALLCRAYGVAATDPDHCLDFAGTGALCEYGLCRFSPADEGDCAAGLSAACVSASRAAFALLVGNLRAGGADGGAADFIRRCHGPADSAVRDWGFSGVYALASGNGGALAEAGRRSVEKCGEWGRRDGDWADDGGGAGD